MGIETLEFQFLIGTLKTQVPHISPVRGGRFQFLIGTLKTITLTESKARLTRFNSS